MKMPIFNHREIVGYASSINSARRVLRKILDIHPLATLHIWHRNTDVIDLPAGFVYAISFGGKS